VLAWLRGNERGAAAVEFALVLPILLVLVFGIVDFSRAYGARVTVIHAAREGVRVQALGGTAGQVATATQGAATPLTVTVSSTACTPGQPTSVTATTTFTYITPIAAFGGGGFLPTRLSGRGVMRCGG
jgi:Flp pilus assembly protein TadG